MKTNHSLPDVWLAYILLLVGGTALLPFRSLGAVPAAVTVVNTSVPTSCAEEDNVAGGLVHPAITSFTVEARPPGYPITVDITAPNFENCSFGTNNDPVFTFPDPRQVKLFDNGVTAIIADRYASFWRSNVVSVRVGSSVASGMHTITLHRKITGVSSWPQCLVLYGADGNMRLKPHPPTTLPDNVFGASVLLGPVTNELRPVVNITAVEYVPASDDLLITYQQGGTAKLHIQEISRSRFSMNVSLSTSFGPGQPFAMARSMFVNSTNCDTELGASWLTGTNTWEAQPILQFSSTRAREVLFYRTNQPQAHNRSAPDIWFGNFEAIAPSLSAQNDGDSIRILCPLWTIDAYELAYATNILAPVWQVSTEPKVEKTYHYEVAVRPQLFGSAAFFRLQPK